MFTLLEEREYNSTNFLKLAPAIARSNAEKKKHLLKMKHRRGRRANRHRDRVKLRNERLFIKKLESNPFRSKDQKWTFRERRTVSDLVFRILPCLVNRFKHERLNQVRTIILYEYYLTLLNAFRCVRGLEPIGWKTYIRRIVNRRILEGDGCFVDHLQIILVVGTTLQNS